MKKWNWWTMAAIILNVVAGCLRYMAGNEVWVIIHALLVGAILVSAVMK
jgi:hypothetical protein